MITSVSHASGNGKRVKAPPTNIALWSFLDSITIMRCTIERPSLACELIAMALLVGFDAFVFILCPGFYDVVEAI